MILAVDIGNASVSMGIFKKDELLITAKMSSSRNHTREQYAIEMIDIFSLYKIDRTAFEGAIIGSVVPEMSNTVKDAVKLAIGCDAVMLAPGLKTGLNIQVDEPSQVGEDFVAESVAACKYAKSPCLIIDLKTATKISVIDKNNTFIGAIICPGVEISVKALSQRRKPCRITIPRKPKRSTRQ